MEPRRATRKAHRVVAAAALAAGTVTMFVALGGVSSAQGNISASQYQYDDKVTLCHKGKTRTVGANAAAAHFAHGDTPGPCP